MRSPARLVLVLIAPLGTAGAAEEEKRVAPIPLVEVKTDGPIVFDKHVYPILAEKCTGCHDAEGGLAENELDLVTVAAIQKGGKRGPAIVPSKGAESLLVRLAGRTEKPTMPPDEEVPLSSEELSILKLWIDQGARPGDDLAPAKSAAPKVVLEPLPPGVHPVYALDLDRSGHRLAAGRANQVFVYDLPTGTLEAQLAGHQDLVQSVAFSPDGAWLASGGYRVVKLWRVPQPTELGKLTGHSAPIKAIAVNVARKLAASGSDDKKVRLWNLADRKEVRELAEHPAAVWAVAFDPQGDRLATGSADNKIRLFRTADGALVETLDGHAKGVTCLSFGGPDGNALASGSEDGTLRVWDVASANKEKPPAERVRVLTGHEKPIRSLAVLANNQGWISADESGAMRVWDPEGKPVRELAHGSAVAVIAVSPDGQWLASTGADATVKLHSLAEGKEVRTLAGLAGPATGLAVRPDGQRLAASAGQEVLVWDPATGRVAAALRGYSAPVATLAYGAEPVELLAGAANELIVSKLDDEWHEPIELGPLEDRVLALAFSPDGKLLATGGGSPAANGELKMFDLAEKKLVRELPDAHSDSVFGLAFSPDGKRLASGSADTFLKVHEVETGALKQSFEGHTHHVLAVAWKGDGKELATASADNTVKLWNTETGEQIRTVGGHGGHVTDLAFVGDSANLVTSCADRQARLIDANSGNVTRGYGGSENFLYAVACTAEGKLLVAGDHDGKVFLWNGADGALQKTLTVDSDMKIVKGE